MGCHICILCREVAGAAAAGLLQRLCQQQHAGKAMLTQDQICMYCSFPNPVKPGKFSLQTRTQLLASVVVCKHGGGLTVCGGHGHLAAPGQTHTAGHRHGCIQKLYRGTAIISTEVLGQLRTWPGLWQSWSAPACPISHLLELLVMSFSRGMAAGSEQPSPAPQDHRRLGCPSNPCHHTRPTPLKTRLQEIVDEHSTIVVRPRSQHMPGEEGSAEEKEYTVKFEQIYLSKPTITEADGEVQGLFPKEARLRNLT